MLLMHAIDDKPWRVRARRGWVTGFIMFVFSLAWTRQFSAPGWIVLSAIEALFIAAAAIATPQRKFGIARHALVFVAALTLAELVRIRFPLGGLPIGGITTSAAGSPFAWISGVFGEAGMVTVLASFAIVLNELRRFIHARRRLIIVPVALLLIAMLASVTAKTTATGSVRITTVQAGGPQGLKLAEQQPERVFRAHYELTEQLGEPGGIIVWPEDVVDVDAPIQQTHEGNELSRLAIRTKSYLGAGVVERDINDTFRNAFVVWNPQGQIVSRYEKFNRVPFGEYVPARGALERFVDLSQVPYDAVKGSGASYVEFDDTRAATAISFEGLFAQRVRSGVREGGEVVLIPTNAASYTSPRVAKTQLQSARYRAIESGRDVVQSAPTGISAFVNSTGKVTSKSTVGNEFVIHQDVQLRAGQTFFTKWGDAPLTIAALLTLMWGYRSGRREQDRDLAGGERKALY